jgi:NAD(P)-dependent dehydrogenase (short-subunit alcohol dehydrogenase family)
VTVRSLAGRTALVTGAAQGIGRAIAVELASRGARLILNDLSAARLLEVRRDAEAVSAPATAVAADVTNADDVRAMFDDIAEHCPPVDILVNSAGILRGSKIAQISAAEWDLVVGVNLKGTFLVSQAAVQQMRAQRWGRIVNLSSTAGKNVSTLGGSHYAAAKAGVLGFTRQLASEVAGDGITVNAVCPGLIDTDMVRSTVDADTVAGYERSFPISRLGRPEEVAALVAFLCSDEAAYITGASLDINGGDLMV